VVNRVSIEEFTYDSIALPSRDKKREQIHRKESLKLSQKIGLHSVV